MSLIEQKNFPHGSAGWSSIWIQVEQLKHKKYIIIQRSFRASVAAAAFGAQAIGYWQSQYHESCVLVDVLSNRVPRDIDTVYTKMEMGENYFRSCFYGLQPAICTHEFSTLSYVCKTTVCYRGALKIQFLLLLLHNEATRFEAVFPLLMHRKLDCVCKLIEKLGSDGKKSHLFVSASEKVSSFCTLVLE